VNLGEWINFSTYAVFDGDAMELRSFNGKEASIYKNW
jgi:UDP-2,3-diacylglucosamine hydrolase